MDYNTEDTGKLMTEGLSVRRRKRLILALIAIIAVAAVAGIFGYRFYGDRKYNDQIAIAEKALSEGRYEEAEAAYLKAVDMKKRDVPARKGLAYTYALESKFEDATREYEELYDMTDDEVFKDAADDTSEERMPDAEELIPDVIPWTEIPIDSIPDPEGITEFTGRYMTFFDFYYYESSQRGGALYENYDFDAENPYDGYVLPVTAFMVNDKPGYEGITEYLSGSDPRGWNYYYDGHQRLDKEVIDKVSSDLFNLDEEGIKTALESAENSSLMYLEDNYYYKSDLPIGIDFKETEIVSCLRRGSKYCIEYTAASYDLSGEMVGNLGTYYAVMGRENIDGEESWSMYYNGVDKPDYVTEASEQNDSDATEASADGSYAVFSQLEGVQFMFASGAGAWETDLSVHADGSFEGDYHDSDMGVTGDGYPNGTRYESHFTGKFTEPVKINDYIYEFKIEYIETERDEGEEYIEDGVLIICSGPYGLENADRIELYLPEAQVKDLPENYTNWLIAYGDRPQGALGGYGLYNVAEEEGFFGFID